MKIYNSTHTKDTFFVMKEDGSVKKVNNNESQDIIGELLITFEGSFALFSELYVYPKYREKGVAKKIRKKAIKYVLKQKIKKIKTFISPFEEEDEKVISLNSLTSFYKKSFSKNGAKQIITSFENDYNIMIASFKKKKEN